MANLIRLFFTPCSSNKNKLTFCFVLCSGVLIFLLNNYSANAQDGPPTSDPNDVLCFPPTTDPNDLSCVVATSDPNDSACVPSTFDPNDSTCLPATVDPNDPVCSATSDPNDSACIAVTSDPNDSACAGSTSDPNDSSCLPATADPTDPNCGPPSADPNDTSCIVPTSDPNDSSCSPQTSDPNDPSCGPNAGTQTPAAATPTPVVATPEPTPTPRRSGKSFTFKCKQALYAGAAGLESLILRKGTNEPCTITLTNLEPGVNVQVMAFQRNGIMASVQVEPITGVTDANGELEIIISAIARGIDWVAWAVPNDKGQFEFSKRAYDNGTAWGMFVEVK